ncbi:carboxylate--amine ligase [Pseudofrankia sp. BMG5.36]|nr:carboxylate--amine ligase [Pseudofrankia sp. BMG5.36]
MDGRQQGREPVGAAAARPWVRTVGVEEEFLLFDPVARVPRAAASRVLARAGERSPGLGPRLDGEGVGGLDVEFTREQVETASAPQSSLAAVRACLVALRRTVLDAGAAEGVALAATATSPTPASSRPTPKRRYQRMYAEFGLTATEQLTCGCHVHVAVRSRTEAVGALDRLRPWLAPLVALSANSPFWQGRDTGYASFRTQVWQRWPTAGPTAPFGSLAEYERLVDLLIGSGAALDGGMIYFDARLSRHWPTLELRVADVCLSVDDTVLLAALARALVSTMAADWADGRPVPDVRPELLRAASWRAARYGLSAELLDPECGERATARTVVDRLVTRVGPALAAAGDLETVVRGVGELFDRGTGADRQRAAYHRRGRIHDVVDLVLRETADDIGVAVASRRSASPAGGPSPVAEPASATPATTVAPRSHTLAAPAAAAPPSVAPADDMGAALPPGPVGCKRVIRVAELGRPAQGS